MYLGIAFQLPYIFRFSELENVLYLRIFPRTGQFDVQWQNVMFLSCGLGWDPSGRKSSERWKTTDKNQVHSLRYK